MQFESTLDVNATLDATLVRADGTQVQFPNLSTDSLDVTGAYKRIRKALGFWKFFWKDTQGLVTTAGVNYLAADFISGGSNHIAAFVYQDCGTGATAAAIGDTALQTPAGTARVSGTQSTPTSGQYRNVATISFTSSLAITEFGLFSASTSGTLWDRRVFAAINVASGDSIQFTYTLTVNAGGA